MLWVLIRGKALLFLDEKSILSKTRDIPSPKLLWVIEMDQGPIHIHVKIRILMGLFKF